MSRLTLEIIQTQQNAALLGGQLEKEKTQRDKSEDLQDQAGEYNAFVHDGSALEVWIGVTQALSISTATDRCSIVTDRINRSRFRTSAMMPSSPSRDPPLIRTRCPT